MRSERAQSRAAANEDSVGPAESVGLLATAGFPLVLDSSTCHLRRCFRRSRLGGSSSADSTTLGPDWGKTGACSYVPHFPGSLRQICDMFALGCKCCLES